MSLAVIATVNLFFAADAYAQDVPSEVTLFKNVKVFNGTEDKLHDVDVLVVKNKIHKVAKDIPTTGSWEIDAKTGGAKRIKNPFGGIGEYQFQTYSEEKTIKKTVKIEIIDGGGRTLMPGLIDTHTHFTHALPGAGIPGFETTNWQRIGAMATVAAKEHLMNGFTTVREMGGGAVAGGLKSVIDEGHLEGPRIYPSGAYISQTAGHADFLSTEDVDQMDTNLGRLGIAIVADGPDEVRKAVRTNLGRGASQIKLMVGGGVTSLKDPLFTQQFTSAEIAAAVEAAAQFDTYVGGHVYGDADVRRAVEAGLLSVEHGQFISDETAKVMIEKGAFLSLNLAGTSRSLLNHPVYGAVGTPPHTKTLQFLDQAAGLKKVLQDNPELVVTFQTDLVFTLGEDLRRGIDFEKFQHGDFMGNFRALKNMTSNAAKLMAASGKLNPYPAPLGVIEEGAYADILLVDGNPLEDLAVIGANSEWFDAPARNQDLKSLRLIMKDGKIYKNTLRK